MKKVTIFIVGVVSLFLTASFVFAQNMGASPSEVGEGAPQGFYKGSPSNVENQMPAFAPNSIQGRQIQQKTPEENEFLELRKAMRTQTQEMKNEFLEANDSARRAQNEVIEQVRNEGRDREIQIRETLQANKKQVMDETNREIEEVMKQTEAKKQEGIEAFRAAQEAAREEAQRIREEARKQVEALKENALEKIKQNREQFSMQVQAVREDFQKKMEQARNEFQQKLEERKAKLQEEIQKIKDQQKQEIVLRVNENIHALNKKMMEKFSVALEKMESVLANVSTRADKAEAGGQNVNAVRSEIDVARNAITAARAAISAQSAKVYSFTITSAETLGTEVSAARDALKTDLQNVKTFIDKTRTAVQNAINALNAIPNVNGYDVETTSSTPSQE